MNGQVLLVRALWAVAGAGAVGALASAAVPQPVMVGADDVRPNHGLDLGRRPRRSTGRPDSVVARNLFRLDRRPAPERYSVESQSSEAEPPPLRPGFRLRGLAVGPVASAVIEGFPGKEGGQVVRAGEEVAGFRIQAIRRDLVIILGADTVWVLRWNVP